MKKRICRKASTYRLLSGLFFAAAGLAVAQPALPGQGHPIPSGQAQTGSGTVVPKSAAENPAAGPVTASAMTIHIDPVTGRLLKEPAPGSVSLQLPPQLQNALSTSHQGLVEVPSPKPGGGMMLDLQGRFQSPLMATIGADGKVSMHHLGEPAKSDDKK